MSRHMIIGTLKLKPGNRPAAEQVADQGVSQFEALPGFEQVIFFLDEEKNEYGGMSIWESAEAASEADGKLTPGFEAAFGDLLEGSIETRVFEIYEPNQ